MEEVRRLTIDEIPAALALCRRVFTEFVAPYYGEEGVKSFMAATSPELNILGAVRSDFRFYGAFVKGELAGVSATREGGSHIILLFVDKRHHRKGFARALVERMKRDSEMPYMTVNASPYAVEAYVRMGFVKTAGKTTREGVVFTPMRIEFETAI